MASALRAAILGHVRVPVVANGSKLLAPLWTHRTTSVRSMSSHDDHLEKTQVIDRILDIVKSFPKVDPSKVTPEVHFQKDLGLDSLDNVEIIMAIEEEFKLEIPDKEADKIDSCALAIEYDFWKDSVDCLKDFGWKHLKIRRLFFVFFTFFVLFLVDFRKSLIFCCFDFSDLCWSGDKIFRISKRLNFLITV
ncbi:putative Acyl carrier protein (ACP) [Helianthus debilis subsp. tardiflorus]